MATRMEELGEVEQQLWCKVHTKRLEHFCCNELLCGVCLQDHRGHDFYHVDSILPKERQALQESIRSAGEGVMRAGKMMREVLEEKETVHNNGDRTSDTVHTFFEKMKKALEDRERALQSTVKSYTDKKLNKLNKQHKAVREHHDALSQIVSEIEKLRKSGDITILRKKQEIARELEERRAALLTLQGQLSESKHTISEPFLQFSEGSTLKHSRLAQLGTLDECQRKQDGVFVEMSEVAMGPESDGQADVYIRSGSASARNMDDYMYCSSTLKEPLESSQSPPADSKPNKKEPVYYTVVESNTAMNDSKDQDSGPLSPRIPLTPASKTTGQRRDSESKRLTALPPPAMNPAGLQRPPLLPKSRPSRSSETYPSELYDDICINSRSISSSDSEDPFYESLEEVRRGETVPPLLPERPKSLCEAPESPLVLTEAQSLVVKPVKVIERSQLGASESADEILPCGLCCIGPGDNIVITDVRNHCVRLLNSEGRLIRKITQEKQGGARLQYPTAVAAGDDHCSILVAERDSSHVQKFDVENGRSLLKFGQKGKIRASQLSKPQGVAVCSGNVYVADYDKSRVSVYQSCNGKHLYSIGKDIFGRPIGICFNKERGLLVADASNHCVWHVTMDGEIKGKIGEGHLCYPHGVAVGKEGTIIVTETGKDRVMVFSPQGEVICCFGKHGSEPGMFNCIQHVCVNSQGQIIVADMMNQRLQVFEL